MNIKEKALHQIKEHHSKVSKIGFSTSPIKEKQYNYEFTASKNGNNIKVLVYFGKKGVRKVLQGNNSIQEYNELSSILTDEPEFLFNSKKSKSHDSYIGTDETGKGDYFGPLVVAGFYFDNSISAELSSLGVRDSKELNDNQINLIASKIKDKFQDRISIISLEPIEYNKLYQKFNNLNLLLNDAHSKVVENLLKKHNVKAVITDKFSKSELTIANNNKYDSIDFIQEYKAEKYLGVAVASILARNTMNIWFELMELKGINLIKGSSGNIEEIAKKIIKNFGKENLVKFAKLHFKTTKKILDS